MFFDNTVFDITTLRQHPDEFIIGCQPLIQLCVGYYVRKKMFAERDTEDLVQSVNEKLIVQLPAITAQYNGSSDLQTYMSVVIHNICLKLNRDRYVAHEALPIDDLPSRSTDDPSSGIQIRQEVERLRVILILLYRKRNKFLLCAKYYYHLPVTENDIRRTFLSIQYDDINSLLRLNDPVSGPKTLVEIFSVLSGMFSKYEKSKTDLNSLRRWTVRTIDEVIRQLNGDPPEYAHDDDSLKDLIDEYCHSEFNTNT